jgi:hypothetical protein
VIRGYLRLDGARRRPFVAARVAIASQRVARKVDFLVDTGADGTLLGPADAILLRVDLSQLAPGPPSAGVGGRAETVYADASVTLDSFTYQLSLRILAPRGRAQRGALAHMGTPLLLLLRLPSGPVRRGAQRSDR